MVVRGNPLASELYGRVILPSDDDDFMPAKPNRNPPLSAAQIRLLEWWIVEGAAETLSPAQEKRVPADVRTILAASGGLKP